MAVVMAIALLNTLFTPLMAQQKSGKDSKPAPAAAPAAPKIDYNSIDYANIGRIRQEGLGARTSKVMEIESGLTDFVGPRLTGSPNAKHAVEWAQAKMKEIGLENVHAEAWGPFGRGWAYQQSSVRMTAPDTQEFIALPKAWSSSTNGTIKGKLVRVNATTSEELAKLKGTLNGAIVLLGTMRDVATHSKAEEVRYDEKSLAELAEFQVGGGQRGVPANFDPNTFRRLQQFAGEVTKFLADEKVALVIEPSRAGDGGAIFVQSFSAQQGKQPYAKDALPAFPNVVMAIEHYGRLSRLLDMKQDVQIEATVTTKFYDDDPMSYNVVGEIPGTDLKDEVVMLGGHLDSWHGGTGATDNAAGCAAALEAVRILKALDIHPRRTIRVGLWTGEEEGLFGSRNYVKDHFGGRPGPIGQFGGGGFGAPQAPPPPMELKSASKAVSAYYNIDNGTGRIRGIYLQENPAVAPIFEEWMKPFHDLGMTTLTMRNTGGTDHLSFDGVGIPGFQFIQDEVEYDTRTHHSNMDVYERMQRPDMMINATIEAAFVYLTAQREDKLPRKPLPADTKWVEEAPAAAPAVEAKKEDGKKKK